jgi:bifunctional UDP-N-acetylglucosamine pyrophosphorylase/glucosamine-1-phosphate N-acetyltransferase
MRATLPKVLHPVGGQPMLAHVLHTVTLLNPAFCYVVYGQAGQQIRAQCSDYPCQWVLQAEPRGTGHAVHQVLPGAVGLEKMRVLILYGDVPLVPQACLKQFLDTTPVDQLGIMTVQIPDPTGLGRIVRDKSDRVIRVVEEKEASAQERTISEVNTGIYLVPGARLAEWLPQLTCHNTQMEYYLTDIVALAVASGVGVKVYQAPDYRLFQGVNDQAQLALVERLYQKNQVEHFLRQGVRFSDPDRVDIRGSLTVGMDVHIDVGCIFEGRVVLGDGCVIAPYCILKNVVLGKGVRVRAFSILEGVEAGEEVRIGPFARVRPDTVLGDQSQIGNFVEIKKTTVGVGSKINHLSYVGDAHIGSGVNVGAGTITCNYDGVNKHRTDIEAGAFIGSNSTLIAPVTIGRAAYIGAGSVISKTAPPDKLTLARQKQQTVEGWQRPIKLKTQGTQEEN